MEIWKEVTGFEGLYAVSTYGRVKSLSRSVTTVRYGKTYTRVISEKILLLSLDGKGYPRLTLSKNGRKNKDLSNYRSVKVHRLVAEHFLSNPECLPMVNHIDANKQNNHVDNLEWCTAAYNSEHAMSLGLIKHTNGEKAWNSVLLEDDVSNILRMKHVLGMKNHEIITTVNLPKGTVTSILNRRNWKHVPIPVR